MRRDGGWPGRSTLKLGIQVWYAQARVHVRLTHAATFLLLALGLALPPSLAAALARRRRRGLRIVEVERMTIPATRPAATHLHDEQQFTYQHIMSCFLLSILPLTLLLRSSLSSRIRSCLLPSRPTADAP